MIDGDVMPVLGNISRGTPGPIYLSDALPDPAAILSYVSCPASAASTVRSPRFWCRLPPVCWWLPCGAIASSLWGLAEPGRGYFLEVQGRQAFVSMFACEGNGDAVWYVF